MKKVSSGVIPVIPISRKALKPLHRQLYDGLRDAIMRSALLPGQRIPSSRGLASELGISRIVAVNAYAQLQAEGYLESRVGSGTVVCRSLPDQMTLSKVPRRAGEATRTGPRRIAKRARQLDPVMLSHASFARTGQPHRGAFVVGQVACDEFPFQTWNALIVRHGRTASATALDYGDVMGSQVLREAIASYLRTARGARCEADQVMIVSGSQQALELAARVLLDPGDRVWMEEPGYRVARSVFRFHGCPIVAVPVDQEGLNVEAGMQRGGARAVLVTPSHQFPTGVTMSVSRRLQLLDWAESSRAWIIEDDYDSEYRYDCMPIGCLQGLDVTSRVIYVGTFSKVLFPSLRLGYLVLPPDLIERFVSARLTMDIAPPGFLQGVLADFIHEGHFSRHLRRMRLLYGERRSALIESIRKGFGTDAEITGDGAGLHVSLTLPRIDDRRIATLASEQGLWLAPLSYSYIGRTQHQGFILGFGTTRSEEMPNAIRKLRSIVDSAEA